MRGHEKKHNIELQKTKIVENKDSDTNHHSGADQSVYQLMLISKMVSVKCVCLGSIHTLCNLCCNREDGSLFRPPGCKASVLLAVQLASP